MENNEVCWLTTYEYAESAYVLTRVDLAKPTGWNQFSLDETVSDPLGAFKVFWIEPNGRGQKRTHGRVTIKSLASGNPVSIHSNFDMTLLGSPTLWPASNRRAEKLVDGYMWRTSGKHTPWRNEVIPKGWNQA